MSPPLLEVEAAVGMSHRPRVLLSGISHRTIAGLAATRARMPRVLWVRPRVGLCADRIESGTISSGNAVRAP
jgi:hypothetical protein